MALVLVALITGVVASFLTGGLVGGESPGGDLVGRVEALEREVVELRRLLVVGGNVDSGGADSGLGR